MTSYSKMRDLEEEINKAFKEEFDTILNKSIDSAITKFRSELPGKIARATRFIETTLVERCETPGYEIRFVILDRETLKKEIK